MFVLSSPKVILWCDLIAKVTARGNSFDKTPRKGRKERRCRPLIKLTWPRRCSTAAAWERPLSYRELMSSSSVASAGVAYRPTCWTPRVCWLRGPLLLLRLLPVSVGAGGGRSVGGGWRRRRADSSEPWATRPHTREECTRASSPSTNGPLISPSPSLSLALFPSVSLSPPPHF